MEFATQRFSEDGFVRIPQFLDKNFLSELRGNLERFLREGLPKLAPEHVFYEDKSDRSTLKQLQGLHNDGWFREHLMSGRFAPLAEQLLGGAVVAQNLQYFRKPPRVGRPTPPHQDGYYFKINPCEAVTLWLALDDVDESNGCVRYGVGSHRLGMREHHRTTTLGFSQGISNYPTDEDLHREVPVSAHSGDLLAHHALTVHRADANHSDRERQALGAVFYREDVRVDVATHEAYQDKLHKEMRDAGQI